MVGYLKLIDYAAKYGLSLSTLRRRIKSNQVVFKFENGKYYIMDQAPGTAHDNYNKNRPSPILNQTITVMSPDEEILKLKNEIVDLKTWVAVLEDEIRRIKSHLSFPISEEKSEKTFETPSSTGNTDLKLP
ncbi:MAG: hypothetical protein NZ480_04650 [Bdellovibrionaceae bacterium]|nr:hypothetical protein [Pseudobdellovibrionaceae bacterium]MDW8190769.1 hypothetical protein [Pseudobdellovibrionaceae bacterium]